MCLRNASIKLSFLPTVIPCRTHIRPPLSLGGRKFRRLKGPLPEASPTLAQRLEGFRYFNLLYYRPMLGLGLGLAALAKVLDCNLVYSQGLPNDKKVG